MIQQDQFISQEDLSILKNNKSKTVICTLQAEKAILESQLADSEYRALVLSLCLKYKIQEQCSIDEQTGKVIKPVTQIQDKDENS